VYLVGFTIEIYYDAGHTNVKEIFQFVSIVYNIPGPTQCYTANKHLCSPYVLFTSNGTTLRLTTFPDRFLTVTA